MSLQISLILAAERELRVRHRASFTGCSLSIRDQRILRQMFSSLWLLFVDTERVKFAGQIQQVGGKSNSDPSEVFAILEFGLVVCTVYTFKLISLELCKTLTPFWFFKMETNSQQFVLSWPKGRHLPLAICLFLLNLHKIASFTVWLSMSNM